MTIKGKSDKLGFKVNVDTETLMAFLAVVLDKANLEYDDDLATSPGGLPTAIFTCIVPASAREAVNWDIQSEGWNQEKALAAFEHRLERKSGGGFSIETRQAAWDKKVADMKADGLTEAMIAKYAGKRPEAKTA